MAARTVSGHGVDLGLKSQPGAPMGGSDKHGAMGPNKKMKQATNFGNSGLSGYSATVDGVDAEGAMPTKSSIGGANGSRHMGGGKFPNMVKDMK